MAKDAMNHSNEGQPAALFSLRKSDIWSTNLFPDRGGGNGGGTKRNEIQIKKINSKFNISTALNKKGKKKVPSRNFMRMIKYLIIGQKDHESPLCS